MAKKVVTIGLPSESTKPEATKPAAKKAKATETKPAKKAKADKAEAKAAPVARQRIQVLGMSATSLLRYMGSLGYDFATARRAMNKLGGEAVSDTTVKCQLYSGKNPEKELYGPIPDVTKDVAAAVKGAVTEKAEKVKKTK